MQEPRRLSLANLPTPLQPLERISQRIGKKLYLWRDDLTELAGSGNKIRKLEYLLADALDKKASALVTCGGPQSNHARATCYLARRLGLKPVVIVREPQGGLATERTKTGNELLDQLFGAEIHHVSYDAYQSAGAHYEPFLADHAERLQAAGERPYIIPEGGSCPLGVWGYINAARELLTSWKRMGVESSAPDAVFLALGSGGTLAGLHIGLENAGISPTIVHAINVCDSAAYFQTRVSSLIEQTHSQFGGSHNKGRLNIWDGYVGAGYAMASDEELRFYQSLAQQEGVLLDPCYTGKAFRGMLEEIQRDPSRFGEHIVFLHSGGQFAIFNYARQFAKINCKAV